VNEIPYENWDDLTVDEVRGVLDSSEYDWYELGDIETEDDVPDLKDLGRMRVVERIGGREGAGEYMAVVLQLGSRTFRKEGHYASWDADRWDGPFREVQPVQKMVTVWEEME
jgi:hypothetical protein